jgi:E3 ubiquitin-protein ligase RNF13
MFVYPEPMSAKNPEDIFIPSVFVGEEAGLILKDRYQYDHGYFVVINDEVPFNINTHLLLPFAIVVGICFLVMVVFMVSIQ